jgi:hypothetical protein
VLEEQWAWLKRVMEPEVRGMVIDVIPLKPDDAGTSIATN